MSTEPEDWSPSAARAARETRVVLGRLRRRLRGASDAGDLTPSQASVLARLSKEGPAAISELAAVEGVRHQSMAATVTALGRLGLIERHPDPEDGRRQLISLTADGRERAEGDRQARQEWLSRALQERCTERERQTVIEAMTVLEKLVQP